MRFLKAVGLYLISTIVAIIVLPLAITYLLIGFPIDMVIEYVNSTRRYKNVN